MPTESAVQILRFWMVYGINQGAPNYRHESFCDARAEAERLARQNPGVRFVVLQAVDAVSVELPPVTTHIICEPW